MSVEPSRNGLPDTSPIGVSSATSKTSNSTAPPTIRAQLIRAGAVGSGVEETWLLIGGDILLQLRATLTRFPLV